MSASYVWGPILAGVTFEVQSIKHHVVLNAAAVVVAIGMMNVSRAEDFRVDYFPTLHYTKDPARVHLALKGRKNATLVSTVAGGKATSEQVRFGNSGQLIVPLDRNTLQNVISMCVETEGAKSFEFRLVRAEDGLPRLIPRGRYMYDENGVLCMVLAKYQSLPPNRRWQPIRWAAGFFSTGAPPDSAVVISDLVDVAESEDVDSVPPMHRAIARLSKRQTLGSNESLTLHLGNQDVALQTSPEYLRLGIETILQHLISLDAEDIRLAQPMGAQIYRSRLKAYRGIIRKLGHDYRVRRVFDVTWYLENDPFLMPDTERVYRKQPDAAAMTKIAQILKDEGLKPK